uniref:tRNA-t(6)A37 methylthiotransferase n=1 Tax=Ascaris lumbricoides TaxID=6252 RepID=A0A0M3HNK0_ASCLU
MGDIDIEDGFDAPAAVRQRDSETTVKLRQRLRQHVEPFHGDSFVPGTETIFVRTWGCSHNTSDSEYMTGLLSMAGYNIISTKENASLWVLNSCTVKTPSEDQLENEVKKAKEAKKFIVVAGCVSQADPNAEFLRGVSLVGVKQIDRIVEVVEETLKGNCVRLLSRKRPEQKLSLPKMRRNNLIEVLAVSSGCLNNCTYCKTKQARGDLVSYPPEELVEQAVRAFSEGCREIWLTSEDLGAWGRDFGMVLPDLLKAMVDVIPEGCMMRLGMTNPPYILDFLDEIAEILNHPRVYSFLHIPVQSGSDAVLRDMNREYSSADFCRVVDFMLQNVPNVYIATDFICAFPTETIEDFEESMQLVHRYRFPSVFINQFYPRKGTPAARLKKITTTEARRRTAAMSSLFRSYTRYGNDRLGMEYDVLVCEWATDKVHFVAHNKCYEHFLLPCDDVSILGQVVRVRVTGVGKFHMNAEMVRSSHSEVTCAGELFNLSTRSVGAHLRQICEDCVCRFQSPPSALMGVLLSAFVASVLYFLLQVH